MKVKSSFIYSFRHSLPVLFGFLPVGILYGIIMASNEYNFIWTGICSVFVFAGSLQYLMIDFFNGTTSYLNIAVMAALLNSRHIFYGLPFINKWKHYGFLKYFLIFALPDETFSLHISAEITDSMNEKLVYMFNAIFVLLYWAIFTIAGSLIGSLLSVNTDGMDFALTALFAVIVVDQFKSNNSFIPGIIAIISSLTCILLFGSSYFILPSLVITLCALLVFRPRLEKQYND